MKLSLVSGEDLEALFKRWFGPIPDAFDERDRGEVAREAFLAGARSVIEHLGVSKIRVLDFPEEYAKVWRDEAIKGPVLVRAQRTPK